VSAGPTPTLLEWRVGEVLFDMDGTLIDSIDAIEDAWSAWATAEDVVLPSASALHGRTAHDLVSSLVPSARIAEALERLNLLEQHPTAPIRIHRGALELIAGIPAGRWAIVTSATRLVALARLSAAGIPLPELLIAGDEVDRGKPDPEPYRIAQRRDGSRLPAVAFEDAVAGLRSAKAAGCLAVGIAGTVSADELRPYADAVIESLADVEVLPTDHGDIRLRVRPLG